MKGRSAFEGGSCLWGGRRSVSLQSNRQIERSPWAGKRMLQLPKGGGFAPVPLGFSALMPVPMRGLYQPLMKKGCRGIPPRSVEATESALGLLPSMALSSAQLRLIITAGGERRASRWALEYGTLSWGKDARCDESPSPKEATQ